MRNVSTMGGRGVMGRQKKKWVVSSGEKTSKQEVSQ